MGLVTTSLAVNADIGIHRDRLLNQDELIEYMTRQIKAAAKLGFPIARVQISIEPDSMEALAPIAEEHGVTLALEVHADQYASHPRILALRDRYEKVGSPFLGFTMDWGATVSGFAPSLIEAYRRRGASEELLGQVVDLWNTYYEQGPPADQAEHGQRFGSFIGLAARNGRPDLGIDFGINGTGLFGPARVDDWLAIAPWIKHVHGKFFGIDENGEEPSVPVRDLVTPARGERLQRRDLQRVRGLALEPLGVAVRHHPRRAGRAALRRRRRRLAHDHRSGRGTGTARRWLPAREGAGA